MGIDNFFVNASESAPNNPETRNEGNQIGDNMLVAFLEQFDGNLQRPEAIRALKAEIAKIPA